MAPVTDIELMSGGLADTLDRLIISGTMEQATTVGHAQRRTFAEGAPDAATGAYVATNPRGMEEMAAAKAAANRAIIEHEGFRRAYGGKPSWWPNVISGWWSSLVEHFATQDEHTLSGTRLPGLSGQSLDERVAEALQPYDIAAVAQSRATQEGIAGIGQAEGLSDEFKGIFSGGMSLGAKIVLAAAGLLFFNSVLSR